METRKVRDRILVLLWKNEGYLSPTAIREQLLLNHTITLSLLNS